MAMSGRARAVAAVSAQTAGSLAAHALGKRSTVTALECVEIAVHVGLEMAQRREAELVAVFHEEWQRREREVVERCSREAEEKLNELNNNWAKFHHDNVTRSVQDSDIPYIS